MSGSVAYNTVAHVDIIPADGDIVVTKLQYIVPTGLCFRSKILKILYTTVNHTLPSMWGLEGLHCIDLIK